MSGYLAKYLCTLDGIKFIFSICKNVKNLHKKIIKNTQRSVADFFPFWKNFFDTVNKNVELEVPTEESLNFVSQTFA